MEQAEALNRGIDRGDEFVWFAPYVEGTPAASIGRSVTASTFGPWFT